MPNGASGPLSGRPLGVIDLHTHPSLKMMLFNRKFWGKHIKPAGFFPLTLRMDIDSLIEGNVKAFLCTAYVLERDWATDVWPLKLYKRLNRRLRRILDNPPDQMANEYLDIMERQVEETCKRRGIVIEVAKSYDHMQRIMAEGKIAVLHALEGAHHLNGKIENLDHFHRRGVCQLIVPHMYPNEAGHCVNAIPTNQFLRKVGCFKEPFDVNAGITEWGRELVNRMFDLGMLVDVTHGTLPFRRDVLEMAKAHPKKRPVIVSHAGLYKFCPASINPNDEEIKMIADTGGVIGIIAMSHWLVKPERHECLDIVLASVDHLINIGGEEVVAFGSDFDGFTGVPKEWRSPSDYNCVREALLQKYSETQVEKFLGGNADRVLRMGWNSPN